MEKGMEKGGVSVGHVELFPPSMATCVADIQRKGGACVGRGQVFTETYISKKLQLLIQ